MNNKLTAIFVLSSLILLIISSSVIGQNNALHFNGGWVVANNPNDFNVGADTDYTIEAVIRTKRTEPRFTTSAIFSKMQTSPLIGYQFWLINGILAFEITRNGPSEFIYANTYIGDGQCHHVAVVVDRSAQNAKLYVDGLLEINVTHPRYGANIDNPAPVAIGRERLGTGSFRWFGEMDEVAFFNTVRTADEIALSALNALSGSESNLLAYYKFDSGVPGGNNVGVTTAIDETGGNDGNLTFFSLSGNESNWVESPCQLIEEVDTDGDGIADDEDNCPNVANANQLDTDGDGEGDVCDACPLDADNDADGDGVCGDVDNCPADANANQLDTDGDGEGDVCDACPMDADNDADGDGVCGDVDNCPADANANQADNDNDGQGDVCDNDDDNDGLLDDCDSDPFVDNFTFNGLNSIPEAWKCGNKNKKVRVCHIPSGNPTNAHEICISPNAVQTHLNHGDYLGPCTCTSSNSITLPNNGTTATSYQEALEVFPNPAKEIVNIHFHGSEEGSTLTIYDQLGRTIWSQVVADAHIDLQLNLADLNLENGVYLISAVANGERFTQRLLIAK